MKKILIALTGVALLVVPAGALARPGFHGGFHGGFRGGYYGPAYYGPGVGFAPGAGYADPWYYGPAYYGPAYYGYYGPPAVVYGAPSYSAAPPAGAAPAPQAACGQWQWDAPHARYNWIPGACPAPSTTQVN